MPGFRRQEHYFSHKQRLVEPQKTKTSFTAAVFYITCIQKEQQNY